MKRNKKSYILIGFLTIAILATSTVYVYKNITDDSILNMPFESEISVVRPWEAPGQDWGIVKRQVFSTLFSISATGKLQKDLVDDWHVSKDFKDYRFTIKKDIKFNNGKELTANDIVTSINSFPKNSGDSLISYIFGLIKEKNVIDRYTIEIKLKKPYTEFLLFLAGFGFEVYPADILNFKSEGDNSIYWTGTGPYKIDKFEKGKITLIPNPYYKGSTTYSKINFIVSSNPEKDFLDGKIDLININRDEVNHYSQLDDVSVSSYPMLGSFFLGFNLRNKKLQNKLLRQAIFFSINRSDVVKNYVVPDKYIPRTIVPFGLLGYESIGNTYDLEKAKSIINKINYKDLPNEKDLEILLPRNPHHMSVYAAEKFKVAIDQIGLKSSIRILKKKYGKSKLGDYYHHLRSTNDFSIYLRGMVLTLPSSVLVYEQLFKANSPMNFSKYESEEFEHTIEMGPKSILDSDHKAFYTKLNDIVFEDMPVIPLGILFTNKAVRYDARLVPNTLSPYFLNLNDMKKR